MRPSYLQRRRAHEGGTEGLEQGRLATQHQDMQALLLRQPRHCGSRRLSRARACCRVRSSPAPHAGPVNTDTAADQRGPQRLPRRHGRRGGDRGGTPPAHAAAAAGQRPGAGAGGAAVGPRRQAQHQARLQLLFARLQARLLELGVQARLALAAALRWRDDWEQLLAAGDVHPRRQRDARRRRPRAAAAGAGRAAAGARGAARLAVRLAAAAAAQAALRLLLWWVRPEVESRWWVRGALRKGTASSPLANSQL